MFTGNSCWQVRMPTTVTTVSTGARVTQRTTHHDLSLHGRAGAILILILLCFLTFLISFTTSGWKTRLSDSCGTHRGLWEQCQAISSSKTCYINVTALLLFLLLICKVLCIYWASTCSCAVCTPVSNPAFSHRIILRCCVTLLCCVTGEHHVYDWE